MFTNRYSRDIEYIHGSEPGDDLETASKMEGLENEEKCADWRFQS